MTKTKMIRAFAITLAVLGTTMGSAAFASTSDEVSVEIDTRYLTTDWGVEKVYESLSKKAENLCNTGAAHDISSRKFERNCTVNLLDDFINSANHEKLTTYHVLPELSKSIERRRKSKDVSIYGI